MVKVPAFDTASKVPSRVPIGEIRIEARYVDWSRGAYFDPAAV